MVKCKIIVANVVEINISKYIPLDLNSNRIPLTLF